MTKKHTLLAVAALILVVGGGLSGWLVTRSGDARDHGPLALPAPGKVSIGAPIPLGTPYSYGLLTVENDGDKPVVLDRAELVGPDSGISTLGSFGLTLPQHCQGIPAPHRCLFYSWKDSSGRVHSLRRTAIGFLKGYAVPHDGQTLAGMTVAPRTQIQVVIGVKLTKPGRYHFQEVALDYHVGDKPYHDAYPASGRLCGPTQKYLHHCSGLLIQS